MSRVEGGVLTRYIDVTEHVCKPPSISGYAINLCDEWKCDCGVEWICGSWDEPGCRGGLRWEKR